MANQERVERAEMALVEYSGSADEAIVDLLTDLRHWCDSENLRNFAGLVETSRLHWESEGGE